MTFAVSLENVCKQYGNTDILKNVSFSVEKGGFFIIIGPNGSGKTTLLKTIAGIETINRGSISIFGRKQREYTFPELARNVSYVPQDSRIDFPFTAYDVVLMGRSPHLGILGIESEDDIRIAQNAMEITETDHLVKRKCNQLSGGERQRVYIARAVCQEPKLILLDEPTAALDLGHQTRIMDLMDKLKTEKKLTVVMVSHDVNLAAMYADNILLMKEGEIVDRGQPDKVLTYDAIEKAYNCRVLVDESPLGKCPRITLVPEKYSHPVFS